ncbi:MAG: hydroxymethylbilane synthase [Mariniblastus sp.]
MTKNTNTIRLGTRASKLAMWQSTWVKTQLENNGVSVELIQIKTEGDTATGPLAQIGGQGLFTKQIQIALLENKIDLAVHSLKDLPTEDHPDLFIAAIPQREDTADAFVSNKFSDLASLPSGATIGTGSVRRAAQILHQRNDLAINDIRGNVDTRLKKLDDGEYDAIILACAGLIRLGLGERIKQSFTPDILMPAVGQGALGLEVREDDDSAKSLVGKLNHAESYHRAISERSMLRKLFAGCLAPVGANTWVENGELNLVGVVLSKDGKHRIEVAAKRELILSQELGEFVATELIKKGADEFLK